MHSRTAAVGKRPHIRMLRHLRNWMGRNDRMGELWRQRDWTIRAHLAVFGLVLLVPTVAVGAIALHVFAEGERQRIEHSALGLAADVSGRIDDELQSLIVVLRTLATTPFLDERNFAAFHGRVRLALEGTNTHVVLLDLSMQPILSTLVPYGSAVPAITDAETPRSAVMNGRPQVSNGFVDASMGEPAFTVAVPVRRRGEDRFVLAAIRSSRLLLAQKAPAQTDANWVIGISDGNGIIIDRTRDADTFVGQPISEDARQLSTGTSGVHRGLDREGVKVMRAYFRSYLSGWMTAAFIPVSVVEAPLRRSWVLFGSATLALIALSIAAATHYARLVARPMDALLAGAQALGRGEIVPAQSSTLREANVVAHELAHASQEGRRRDEHLRFVMHELMHRTKNLLALIFSIASQSHFKHTTYEGFRAGFTGRLIALSRSMDILIESDWQGADLADLIHAQLAPFADSRLSASGPDVSLNAEAAQQIGLALHELATNATKYGALSVPGGKVRMEWNFTASHKGDLRLTWQESGGPPVVPPTTNGFGRIVIEEGIAYTFRTAVKLDYAAAGLRWEVVVPWKYLVDAAD